MQGPLFSIIDVVWVVPNLKRAIVDFFDPGTGALSAIFTHFITVFVSILLDTLWL